MNEFTDDRRSERWNERTSDRAREQDRSANDERAPLPERIVRPEPGAVLVLAPHADDEIIGCGGTLALHCAQGDRVRVLVCFDGAAGDPEGRIAAGGVEPRAAIAARRKSEALAAAAHLGAIEYEFWGYPEGHDPSARDLEASALRLADVILRLAPRTIYAPWIGEHHLDHHVVARVARRALAIASYDGSAWGYEVWTPLVAARVVDVTSVWEKKKAALSEHRSQLLYRDLVHASLGLNAQRSIYLAAGARYGEAFAPLAARSGQSDRELDEESDEDRARHRPLSA